MPSRSARSASGVSDALKADEGHRPRETFGATRVSAAARRRYEDLTAIGPGSLAGRLLRRHWQPIYVDDELPARRPVRLRLLGEDFTLYRGESGEPHLIGARCPHRGLLLSTGRVVKENLECFYHGWTFAPDGQCVAQPCEDKSFAHKVRMAGYPIRRYLGLLFAYFGEGDPPEFPVLDIFSGEGFVDLRKETRPWAVFTQIENSVDETHFNFAHRKSKFDSIGMTENIPVLTCEETEYGLVRRGDRAGAVRTGHFFMPNWSLSSLFDPSKGWAEHLVWRVPIDDESHISFIADFIYKTGAEAEAYRARKAAARERLKSLEPAISLIQKIIDGEMHADDVPADRPDIIMIQDGVACMGQGTDRRREDDTLGASDRVVSMLRRLWTREMRAIADGGSTKTWRVPRDLKTTRGVLE